jgi:hypothetical protein
MVVGFSLAGGLLVAHRPGAWAQAAAPPALRNDLATAKSPYLRSAAQQPVAWQQWGPRAFALALALDRPIWLDIGAIWCHWCHVMDRESYENPTIAALINQHFVPIKVDRDERPDIDTRYQHAHAALNQRGGGWPLTMFLTPDGSPFAGATYLPPEQREDRPGMKEIVPRVAAFYHEQRAQVTEVGRKLRTYLAAVQTDPAVAGEITPALMQALVQGIASRFDPQHGWYRIQLHVHNSDLGRLLHVEANHVTRQIRVTFDPQDRTSERRHRVDFLGTQASDVPLTPRDSPPYGLLALGVVVVFVPPFLYFRLRKSRPAQSAGRRGQATARPAAGRRRRAAGRAQ